MKKIVKTDNKLCVKLFTMLLTCSLLLAGLPSAVLADHQDESVDIDFSSPNLPDYVTVTNGTVEDGILKLTESGASIKITKMIKPNTNYTFSFKMKNKVADSLIMKKGEDVNVFHLGQFNDRPMDKLHHNQANYKDKTYGEAALQYFIKGGSFSYVIPEDYKFGSERTESADIKFREVSINFTTPPQKQTDEYSYVTLELSCAVDDDELAIDYLCLKETGNEPNRVFNGDLEAYDASKGTKIPTSFFSTVGSVSLSDSSIYELVYDESANNHYLKVTKASGRDKYYGLKSQMAFLAKYDLTNLGGKTDYKIQVKYKQPTIEKNSNAPRFGFSGASNLKTISHSLLPELDKPLEDKWVTYTLHLNGSDYLDDAKNNWTSDASFGFQVNSYCMDDLYLGFDESNIDFHEQLVFFDNNGSRYFDSVDGATPTGMLMSERSIPAPNLKDITPENGYKLVTPRVHYIPTKNAEGKYDEHNVTLIAAVYGEKNGQRILHSVKLASDQTTKDGKTIDVKIDDLQVPEGKEYTVETMAINMDNMKALVNKTTLKDDCIEVEE